MDDSAPPLKVDSTLTEPTTYDSDGEEPPSNVVVQSSDPEPEVQQEAEKPKKVSKKGVKP